MKFLIAASFTVSRLQAQCNYENSRCEPTVCLALSWSDAQMLISMEQNNDSNGWFTLRSIKCQKQER